MEELLKNGSTSVGVEKQIEDKMNIRSKQFKQKQYSEHVEYAEESVLSERKKVREDLFSMRRDLATKGRRVGLQQESRIIVSEEVYTAVKNIKIENEDHLDEFLKALSSDDINDKYKAISVIRKTLELSEPSYERMIEEGLLYNTLKILEKNIPEFNLEALSILKRLIELNGDNINSIVNAGGLNTLAGLLESQREENKEQIIYLLAEIIGKNTEFRDKAIHYGCLDKILFILKHQSNSPQFANCLIYAISCFFRGKTKLKYDIIETAFETSVKILKQEYQSSQNQEYYTHICWLIAYTSEHYPKSHKLLVSHNVLDIIIDLIKNPDLLIQLACLRIVGNIVLYDSNLNLSHLNDEFVNIIKVTLFSEKKQIRKESCWILSNLSSGTDSKLVNNTNYILIKNRILPDLIKVLKNDIDEVSKEAYWAICNLTEVKDKNCIEQLLLDGILEILCENLASKNQNIVLVGLEGIENLLKAGETYFKLNGENALVTKMIEIGAGDILEGLQFSTSEVIYEKVGHILDKFFPLDD